MGRNIPVLRDSPRDEAAAYLERFAAFYVKRWGDTDSAKAQGWAILQAADALRRDLYIPPDQP